MPRCTTRTGRRTTIHRFSHCRDRFTASRLQTFRHKGERHRNQQCCFGEPQNVDMARYTCKNVELRRTRGTFDCIFHHHVYTGHVNTPTLATGILHVCDRMCAPTWRKRRGPVYRRYFGRSLARPYSTRNAITLSAHGASREAISIDPRTFVHCASRGHTWTVTRHEAQVGLIGHCVPHPCTYLHRWL